MRVPTARFWRACPDSTSQVTLAFTKCSASKATRRPLQAEECQERPELRGLVGLASDPGLGGHNGTPVSGIRRSKVLILTRLPSSTSAGEPGLVGVRQLKAQRDQGDKFAQASRSEAGEGQRPKRSHSQTLSLIIKS